MRDRNSWWAGRKVQTDDGEQGIVLDRVRTLRRLSRRQLARMILEKDYLEIVQWDDGKLELVHENYLLDPGTHIWAQVIQLRPGHRSPRRAVAALGVAFASAVGAAGVYALSATLPQQVILSASSVFASGQAGQTSPTDGSSRMATSSRHVPPRPSSTACPEPASPQPTSTPTSSPQPTGPEPTGPVSFYRPRASGSRKTIPRSSQPTGVTPARCR